MTEKSSKRSRTKLGANFLPTENGNESRCNQDTKGYKPFTRVDTDAQDSGSDDDEETGQAQAGRLLPPYVYKKTVDTDDDEDEPITIPFSSTMSNGQTQPQPHEREYKTNLPNSSITFHRIKADGVMVDVDDTHFHDGQQYHYDNGKDHENGWSKPPLADYNEAREQSGHGHGHGHQSRSKKQQNSECKKSCLKNGISNYDANEPTSQTPPVLLAKEPGRRPGKLNLGSTTSSRGSLITTRESSSMTIGLEGESSTSTHLMIVAEQLEGIQRTQDSILNQLKNDMENLQTNNSKLRRENQTLKARTVEMNGIIDNMSTELDRIKKGLAQHGGELTVLPQSMPTSARRSTAPSPAAEDHEQRKKPDPKESNSILTPSVARLAEKYGIQLKANWSNSEESEANRSEGAPTPPPGLASAALLRVDTPREIELTQDGSLKSKHKKKQKRSSTEYRKDDEKKQESRAGSTRKESGKKSKHRARAPSADFDTDDFGNDAAQHRPQDRTPSTRHNHKEKEGSSTTERKSRQGKGKVRDTTSSTTAFPFDKKKGMPNSAYSQVRKGLKATKNESKKMGNSCWQWLLGKRIPEEAVRDFRQRKERKPQPTSANASGQKARTSRKKLVTLTESESSITATISDRDEQDGKLHRSDAGSKVVVTVAVTDDERKPAAASQSDSETELDEQPKQRNTNSGKRYQ